MATDYSASTISAPLIAKGVIRAQNVSKAAIALRTLTASQRRAVAAVYEHVMILPNVVSVRIVLHRHNHRRPIA